ncbi:tRNA-modifying protein YgfZ [Shewanella surugensis]|uniref:tRNA-modifying protein YgfZ n=1 Tax=Shewanella surugensis TaxID=212020 RepID=A0ABT0LA87_9GAMM|nr:tRNA-modifying protein YgfZ [Shewanella surugensis]MCL1124071.1 tRNA-modifying protein YgfZ [Shewanella surugensis]
MTHPLTQSSWSLDQQTPELMIIPLTHLGLMKISGEQHHSFLQGQVTTDIDSLGTDKWHWGAHCDPKGKMLASFRVFNFNDALLMLMPNTTLQADLPLLAKYAVFSQVELTDASNEFTILGITGTQASTWIKKQFGEVNSPVSLIENGIIIQDNDRFIIIVKPEFANQLMTNNDTFINHSATWQALEILAGYPNIDVAHQGQFVPQMCNLQAINGISFTKGCYMGQETIARMKYRGGNKRALYIISGTTTQNISLNSKLEIALDELNYRNAGKIIEIVQDNDRVLLTAVMPNDTTMEATLRFQGDTQANLRIQPLPYSLEE